MFNIGAVSRMTNILEATLRVWERRYTFPQVTRTSGGHRLYTQQDVFRLQWVKTRIDEGVRVSHAIRALRRAEQDGSFLPVPEMNSLTARPLPEGATLPQLQKRLYDAMLAHDLDDANLLIGEAQALYPLEEIILKLIGPTLSQIGTAWEEGELDVATEHLATNHLRQFMWVWMRVGPPAHAINPVVLACAPGELHEVSLLMLGVLLRRLRWPVLYLGQSMPLEDLSMFIEDLGPSIVVLVAMTEEAAQVLTEWPNYMAEVAASGYPRICFGGAAYVENPGLIAQTQGDYLGDTLQEGVQYLNTVLHQLNPILQ
jgi:DNA-binding transcriptional MerR regulator